jgi:uncharacterized heparinase superfamily protein
MLAIFDAFAGSREPGPGAPPILEPQAGKAAAMSVWRLAASFGSAVATRGRRALAIQLFSNPMWRATLGGPVPDRVLHSPRNLHRRSVRVGVQMLNGRWRLPGGVVECHGLTPFDVKPPNEAWAEALHGFSWLAHLEAAGSDAARELARETVAAWLRTCSGYHPVGWRSHVLARRLVNWLSHARFLLTGADPVLRSHVLWALGRQARHLTRTAASAPEGAPRLSAAFGLTMSGLCLPDGDKRLAAGSYALCQELERQIFPDGAHGSRNPETLAEIYADLAALIGAYKARDIAPPAQIRRALDRMAPALRFFQHGDGKLALFNGGTEGAQGWIAHLLAEDDAQGAPLAHASNVGFHRMTGGAAVLIADAGIPASSAWASGAHAGTLSFEFSHGTDRLVVNCGAPVHREGEWRTATRATAAHSVVTVADASSSHIVAKGLAHAVIGAQLIPGPKSVQSRRVHDPAGQTLVMAHDGYAAAYGVKHQRSLFLSADGATVKGEDRLSALQRPQGAAPVPFTVRFHLHPSVKASLSADAMSVVMQTGSGEFWRLRAGGPHLALTESVYCGDGEEVRRTVQIVACAMVHSGGTQAFQWELARE